MDGLDRNVKLFPVPLAAAISGALIFGTLSISIRAMEGYRQPAPSICFDCGLLLYFILFRRTANAAPPRLARAQVVPPGWETAVFAFTEARGEHNRPNAEQQVRGKLEVDELGAFEQANRGGSTTVSVSEPIIWVSTSVNQIVGGCLVEKT
jgi:hypothetical protein